MWRAIGLAILLTGCATQKHDPWPPTLTAQQQTIGLGAIESLRQAFNRSSSCEAVYDGSAAEFRAGYKDDWLRICTRLQKTDGPWRSFSILLGQQLGRGEIDIYGTAETATGARNMEITWTVDGNRARLVRWLVIEDNFAFPPARYVRQWDTPPVSRRDRSG
jgi:hypothetical protein